MTTSERLSKLLERLLEFIALMLVAGLTLVVVVAVVYRKAGASLTWYDEIASIMLVWITYYGSALAALKRCHIGFPGLLRGAPVFLKLPLFVLRESVVIGFFALLAWVGCTVIIVLRGNTLVSLPQVPTSVTHSVIPIGSVLFIIAQGLSMPEAWRRLSDQSRTKVPGVSAKKGKGGRPDVVKAAR